MDIGSEFTGVYGFRFFVHDAVSLIMKLICLGNIRNVYVEIAR